MTTKAKSNLINIAPFVDVLLVLFVILVVAARFDGPGKDEIAKLNTKIKEQALAIASLSKLKPTVTVVKEFASDKSAPKIVTVTKNIIVDDSGERNDLKNRIADLEEALEKAKHATAKLERPGGGSSANIVFGVEGKITVNGEPVSEDFVYSLLKTTHPDINIGWRGRGHETSDKFQEFAKTLGYGSNK